MFTGFAIRTASCKTTVSVIHIFLFVLDSLLIKLGDNQLNRF